MGHVVELRDVELSFGEKRVLNGVSLPVDPQERLVIIGQSGAGKTTILRLVLGILRCHAFDGQRLPYRYSHGDAAP
jgi:ABC-type transporter Mla maintaining outer membrane lipid asymmetry ATPase subunit MlaF